MNIWSWFKDFPNTCWKYVPQQRNASERGNSYNLRPVLWPLCFYSLLCVSGDRQVRSGNNFMVSVLFILIYVGPRALTHFLSFQNKHLYLMSHFTGLIFCILKWGLRWVKLASSLAMSIILTLTRQKDHGFKICLVYMAKLSKNRKKHTDLHFKIYLICVYMCHVYAGSQKGSFELLKLGLWWLVGSWQVSARKRPWVLCKSGKRSSLLISLLSTELDILNCTGVIIFLFLLYWSGSLEKLLCDSEGIRENVVGHHNNQWHEHLRQGFSCLTQLRGRLHCLWRLLSLPCIIKSSSSAPWRLCVLQWTECFCNCTYLVLKYKSIFS